MKIIVHGGKAHLDEFFACAMAWAWAIKTALLKGWEDVEIFRRDPTMDELDDRKVVVLDVGGQLDAAKSNWDHHQLPRGAKECAMTLLADSLNIRPVLGKIFPWFETRGEVDACGPFATAKSHGLEWAQIAPFLGPLEQLMLERFEKDPVETVRPMAKKVLDALEAYDRVRPLVSNREVNGVGVTDFTAADPADVRLVDAAFLPEKGVAVFHDDRGSGLTLLRLQDDPRVDFSALEGNPEVVFAHKGGFICKTVSKDMAVADDLIRRAVK